MRSLLSASDYTSPEVLRRRAGGIFPAPVDLRGIPVAARSRPTRSSRIASAAFRSSCRTRPAGLRAFVNRCAHRQSALQTRRLRSASARVSVPRLGLRRRRARQVDSRQRCALRLRADDMRGDAGLASRSRCESSADLVFVNLDADPMPLEDQFHEAFLDAARRKSPAYVGDDAMFAKFDGRYNWKLNFENVVDWNHVPFVHASSFASLMPSMRASRPTERTSRRRRRCRTTKSATTCATCRLRTRAPFDFAHLAMA